MNLSLSDDGIELLIMFGIFLTDVVIKFPAKHVQVAKKTTITDNIQIQQLKLNVDLT